MKVYTVLWHDRHCDDTVNIFSTKEVAIEFAKSNARKYGNIEDLNENLTNAMIKAGCLYNAVYSCEGDFLRVEEKEVQ